MGQLALAPNFVKGRELSEEEIIAASSELPGRDSGIYFLIKDDKIVYVGMSSDLYRRLATHVMGQMGRQFDRVTWLKCPLAKCSGLESYYIRKFKPPLNKAGLH